jgi:hypothetical protein
LDDGSVQTRTIVHPGLRTRDEVGFTAERNAGDDCRGMQEVVALSIGKHLSLLKGTQ